jgi:hypothetical protein
LINEHTLIRGMLSCSAHAMRALAQRAISAVIPSGASRAGSQLLGSDEAIVAKLGIRK